MTVPALKLSLYFNETLRSGGDLACDRLLDLFERANVKASVLLRGIEGFGAHHRLHTERLENASLNQPLMAVAVDREEAISGLLPRVDEVLDSGLVTSERAWLLDDPAATALPEVAHDSVKLTIYCGRAERSNGNAAFRAIVDHLRDSGVDASSVFLGVDGTVHGRRERATFFSRNRDVPLMIVAIGRRDAVAAALPGIGRLADAPIMTVEGIQICKRDGELLSQPAPLSGSADAEAWCKLMIHAAGDTHVAGDSLHYKLVEQLRRIDASGATSLRGIWGHRGATAPHGDSIRSLRRTSPVVTIAIEREQRLGEAWRIVDQLTARAGLVTSELVPAHRALALAPSRRSIG